MLLIFFREKKILLFWTESDQTKIRKNLFYPRMIADQAVKLKNSSYTRITVD